MTIKFLNAGCGDAIIIRFVGDDSRYHNIIIDGGTEKGDIYVTTLRKEIQQIIFAKEIIDYWIITHIDDDHIGGLLRFIKDKELINQIDLSKTQFWFNSSNIDYDTGLKDSSMVSVSQGMKLRDFLKQNSNISFTITNKLISINIFGAIISILSPDDKKLNNLMKKWEKEEIKIKEKKLQKLKSSSTNDYDIKLSNFNLSKFTEDSSPENASSIAFLLEYNDKKALFLSDSFPSVIVRSLKNLGYSKKNKLHLDFMQLAHHGSKKNTHDKLLQMISCEKFVVSADGFNKHNLPNKETFARVIKNFPNANLNFFITGKNNLTESIFNVDDTINCPALEFPSTGDNSIILNL
jgi:beta-lactamase superfamily II metal-dependent hydrolase